MFFFFLLFACLCVWCVRVCVCVCAQVASWLALPLSAEQITCSASPLCLTL